MKHDMSQYPLKLEGDNVPMVRFHNVTKKYGKLTVLDGLNLDVEAGEMVTIIGPSGSGKTTVLRMLMTLEPIDSGVIYVDGEPLTHMEKNGTSTPPGFQVASNSALRGKSQTASAFSTAVRLKNRGRPKHFWTPPKTNALSSS